MVYCISKTMEVAGAHRLELTYDSKCSGWHGHNWTITVYLASRELDANGMVEDYAHIKEAIHARLDHRCLNDILPCNPTAENIAAWVVAQFPACYKAVVAESHGNMAQAFDDAFPIDARYLL